MPLLDHFRPPASVRAPWPSLSTSWVSKVMAELNRVLPGDRYMAHSKAYLGSDAEADVSEFETAGPWSATVDLTGAMATVAPPVVSIEATIADEFSVEIRDVLDGMTLVGVIEFVSPANKDRPETRQRLTAKCVSYLDLGVGLVLIDIVTTRTANLHNELVAALRGPSSAELPTGSTYVAGYRPTRLAERWTIDMWPYVVGIGESVPSVPLALKGGPLVPIDLEATYGSALADHRL